MSRMPAIITQILPLFLTICLVSRPVLSLGSGGVCYDPTHQKELHAITPASILSDLQQIKAAGFSHVRTYACVYGNIDLAPLIAEAGLKAALGIPLNNLDDERKKHVEAALRAANGGNASIIFIGNENLANLQAVPKDMMDTIAQVQAAVPDTVQVGTVQRNTEWLDPSRANLAGLPALVEACDILGINLHTFFSTPVKGKSPLFLVEAQWNELATKYPFTTFALTEAGWPTEGTFHQNRGSRVALQTYLDDYRVWITKMAIPNSHQYLFQMFDQPYKNIPFESSIGLFTASGGSKELTLPWSESLSNKMTVPKEFPLVKNMTKAMNSTNTDDLTKTDDDSNKTTNGSTKIDEEDMTTSNSTSGDPVFDIPDDFWATFSLASILWLMAPNSVVIASTAMLILRRKSIGFMPAATLLQPSE